MRTNVAALLCVLLLAFGSMAAEDVNTSDITVETIEPFYYAAVEMTGSYEKHGEGFETLYQQIQSQGLETGEQMPFGIYYDDPAQVPIDSVKWDVGMALPEEQELQEPLTLKKWEHTTLVTMEYEGPITDEHMAILFGKLFGWMEAENYRVSGTVMEKFMSEMTQNDQGQWVGKIKLLLPATKN